MRVLDGPFSGKVGVVQELDGKGGARVMLGLLAVRLDVKDIVACAKGRERPPAIVVAPQAAASAVLRAKLTTPAGVGHRNIERISGLTEPPTPPPPLDSRRRSGASSGATSRSTSSGTVMLAVFQLAMNRIDWQSKGAIDARLRRRPGDAWKPAAIILVLALVAFVVRVASRWYVFNAGRDAEYELRYELLRKLHQLGAAFYRKMPAGEIMSRSTSDLQQVRMLFGFGVAQRRQRRLRVRERAAGHAQREPQAHARVPAQPAARHAHLAHASRAASTRACARTRPSLGRMSDVLQANLAGVRVVRSFALEERERDRFEETNRAYLEREPRARAPARLVRADHRRRSRRIGILVFFWYGSSLLLRGPGAGGLSQGAFFAFWSAFARMTWPMIAVGFALSIVQRGRAGFDAPARRLRRRARGRRRPVAARSARRRRAACRRT